MRCTPVQWTLNPLHNNEYKYKKSLLPEITFWRFRTVYYYLTQRMLYNSIILRPNNLDTFFLPGIEEDWYQRLRNHKYTYILFVKKYMGLNHIIRCICTITITYICIVKCNEFLLQKNEIKINRPFVLNLWIFLKTMM